MLFSSKVTNSVLVYLESKGLGNEALFDSIEVPEEFLRDPSSWIDAADVEHFLSTAETYYAPKLKTELGSSSLVQAVGRECSSLNAWGVLDGVLKMMQGPEELYAQPGRFISYFISPEPVVTGLLKGADEESFSLALSSNDYPCFTTYLATAIESLPRYVNQTPANVEWEDQEIRIAWSKSQENLFEEDESQGKNINPELLKNLIQSLEKSQKELEHRNRELIEKNRELLQAQKQLKNQLKEKTVTQKLLGIEEIAGGLADEVIHPLGRANANIQRLNDYFARAKQLVTILVGRDRTTPAVREAMRRMDWDIVTRGFDEVSREANENLDRVKETMKELNSLASSKIDDDRKVETDLNDLVAKAIDSIETGGELKRKGVKIDRHLLLDRSVKVFPSRFEQAIMNLVNNAVGSIDSEGTVRVAVRPKGRFAEIEISDTGCGLTEEELKSVFSPYSKPDGNSKGSGLSLSIAQSIVEMHDGKITASGNPGSGSTFTVEIPT